MNTIPVIVLNWNGIDDTIECVDSILKQSFRDIKIYIIDNNSDNNEFENLRILYKSKPNIELLKNQSNLGFGKAHNLIFNQLIKDDYEYIALINNDAVADSDWITKGISSMMKMDADIIACKMINYYKRSIIDSAGLLMLSSGEILSRGHGQHIDMYTKIDEVISFSAGACILRLDVIKDVGGFDEYFDTGYEDAELGLRAFLSGYRIIFSPDSIVYHKLSQSISKIKSKARIRKVYEDIHYTCFKLLPWPVILINLPIYLLRFIFLFVTYIIFLRISPVLSQLKAFYNLLFIDLSKIVRIRKNISTKLSLRRIICMMEFPMRNDVFRFRQYLMKKNGR